MPLSIDILALIILGLSLIGVAIVILRKFPTLASIDPTTMVSSLEQRKASLIEERLKRKFQTGWSTVASVSQPFGKKLQSLWLTGQKKLVALEHEYKIRSLPVFLNRRQRHKLDEEIQTIIDQADVFMNDGEYHAAEEKALQAIRLEPGSVPAFETLGKIYLSNKQYGYAKEVYKYLLKLTGEKDAIYQHLGEADLAEGNYQEAEDELQKAIALNKNISTYHLELAQVYRATNEWVKAFRQIEEAARLEPNNPKVLDEYIEISIGAGKKQFAESALKTLASTNPDNSKITDWKERITAMNAGTLPTFQDITPSQTEHS